MNSSKRIGLGMPKSQGTGVDKQHSRFVVRSLLFVLNSYEFHHSSYDSPGKFTRAHSSADALVRSSVARFAICACASLILLPIIELLIGLASVIPNPVNRFRTQSPAKARSSGSSSDM